MTIDTESYEELKQLAETYDEVCERFNVCLICPLSYKMPNFPPCRYIEVNYKIKKIEREIRK